MKGILNHEMSLERVQSLFQSHGHSADVIEVLPAAPELDLPRDAYLRVNFADRLPVIVFVDIHADCQLRMRVIVASREERYQLDEDELIDWATDMNQQLECFGALSPRSLMGITIEYRLPYDQGILEGTILRAAEEMARGSVRARQYVQKLPAKTS
jgi:hypothetical protein